MKKRRQFNSKLLIVLMAACILMTGVWGYMNHSIKHQQIEEALKLHVANIENNLSVAVSKVYVVQSLVVGADGDYVDLDTVGEILRRDVIDRYIDCILLAPEGVVDQVYPREGNEHLLGLNLFSEEYANASSAMDAQRTDSLVISHSYTTHAGDTGIIGQLPVYLPAEDGSYDIWGIVSVCVAFPEIIENLPSDILREEGYAYRILAVNEDASQARELVNRDFVDSYHRVSMDVTLADMVLRIEVVPTGGWIDPGGTLFFLFYAFVISGAVGICVELVSKFVRKLLRDAKTDQLTGLLNRASGEKEINRILQSRDFQKGIFLMLDMDNFKLLNDTFGHQRGDEALAGCARLLHSLFRKQDIICRLGGDEFVVFLHYSGDGSFMEEKVRKLLQTMNRDVSEGDQTVHISASIGMALAPSHGGSFSQLYANADAALYRSKALGRDCCTLYEGASITVREEGIPEPKAPEIAYSDRRTILIVDDDFINRTLIKNIFSDRFTFLEAENGKEGLDLAESRLGELCAILVDASMPVMDGIEMLKVLHSKGVPNKIPVFMITAYAESDVSLEAYKYGVRDVINKPIMPVIIQRRVQTVIELFQARDLLNHIVETRTRERHQK